MKKPTLKSLKEKADSMEIEDAFKWLISLSEEYGEPVKKLADKYYKRIELVKKTAFWQCHQWNLKPIITAIP